MDNVQKKSRPLDSSDEDAGSPKKRKISFENDEATLPETIQADTIPTQPLSSAASKTRIPSTIPTQPLGITSSPPLQSLHITQPTQALRPPTPPNKGVIQVPCSSPFRTQQSTPTATRTLPPTEKGSNTVRPLDFYKNSAANPINLDSQGPHYVAPSDSEISDNEIQPVFAGASKQNANSVVQVPVSPIGMHNIRARYTYAPKPQVGRLDSLNKRPGAPGGIMQRRPEPAKPTGDIKLEDIIKSEHRAAVERMKSIAPNCSISKLLHTLIEYKGNFDDAMERITRDDGDDGDVVDLTGDSVGRQSFKTANRGIGAGKVAIKDKWSSTQAVKRDLTASPPTAAPARKRKLIRGGNRGPLEKDRSTSPVEAIQLDDSDSEAEEDGDSEDERELEEKVLKYINKCDVKELSDFASTTEEIAKAIIDARPFKNIDSIREVSLATAAPAGKRRGRAKPVGDKVVDVCIETWRGYVAVDSLIRKVEALGKPLAESIKAWGVDVHTGGELEMTDLTESDSHSTKDSGVGTPTDDGENDIKGTKRTRSFKEQPKNLREGVVLKDYQLAGINWLNLLYEKKLSCILADEMGLGKTCQVISFFAHLLSKGITGPHLVVVPSSTLENWLREFSNFCPALKVEPYYGSQKERPMIRESLRKDRSWNVLVTTYQLATGDKNDRGFLKSLRFNCCVYDEGHMLKNGSSARYDALIKLPADFRLLLTGTPLQNNLQELASLLAFILPSVFDEKKGDLASIFKYKAKTTDDEESNSALLSAQRIRRARSMMTPFVLRRKKAQVLKHLPAKTQRVEYCPLTESQQKIYDDQLTSAQDSIEARAAGKKSSKTTSNVMMQLRKAAIHPLLFRDNYPDEKLKKMAKDIMKEPQYKGNDMTYIYEDMEVMNDLELHRLCENFPKTIGKYALKNEEWMDSGKIEAFKTLLTDFKEKGDRVLVFSQFTQMMDILEMALTTMDIGYLRIDGSTPVEARQDLIDQYHQEEDIMVFLLSTKAGGFGINLACANKVIIFDSSFNPHDDSQASDRAHRVGQTREVEVIRLITKGTIEEQILQLANTKLALDQSISEGDEKAFEGKAEELVAKMLLESHGLEKKEDKDEA